MPVRVIRKGNTNDINDHNLLFNRGLANQHPIEAISGLLEALNEKYVKPNTGIPISDLGFEVVTQQNLHDTKTDFDEKIIIINSDITKAASDIQALKDIINNYYKDGTGGTEHLPEINFTYKNGFREEFVSELNDTDFHLINKFIPDGGHLMVYRDGELLTPSIDYIEISDHDIKILYPLDEGVYMSFICDSMSTVVSPIHEEIISIADQKEFNLHNEYIPNQHTLSIYVKGLRLEAGVDYEETNPYKITLLKDPYPIGTKFIFRQESIQSAGSVMYHEKDYQQKSWSFKISVEDEQTIVEIPETYIPGSSMIMVTVDGLLQWEGKDFDYIELDETHIQFNDPLEVRNHIKVTCIAALCNWHEKFVTVDDQDILHLNNVYNVGKDDVLVYENGIQLCVDDDYKELNNRTIKLLDIPPFGSKITVYKRR